jgi:hypothetical protein
MNAAMNPLLPSIDPVDDSEARVSARDVERIDVLQELLLTLNDPAASAQTIARHVERYPVLRARVERRYRQRYGERALPRTSAQIVTLGNRELESVLLQLLEDVVAFHCDQKPDST